MWPTCGNWRKFGWFTRKIMEREPKLNWVTLMVFLAIGYAGIFVEARITWLRDVIGAQIDIVPGLMVYAAMAFPPAVVFFCAGFLGMMYDSLSANPLGTTMLSLCAVAAVLIHFREVLLSDQFTTHWVLGLCSTFGVTIISLGVIQAAGEQPLIGAATLWQVAVMTAGGGLLTPVWFRVLNRLDSALRYSEVSESAFRPDRQIARGRN